MVEVQHITKVYGKGKKQTVALDDVSFVLPDSGFIFVVGKSGCGKSTLLNMIGGCDKMTSGEIVVDGNKFSSFKERDYDNFRCDYVGFVFQDYCLLEGLTVEKNVALALELKGGSSPEAVREALEKAELSEYADRYPDELSGGQKQRVAIARTLVKRPKLILADEPTGNLDAKSTRIILDILKEISKTTLVVIVSHDRSDAEEYADRILELSAGKIVGDHSRNPDALPVSISDGVIAVQRGTVFTEEQIENINAELAKGHARFAQIDTKFIPTAPPEKADTVRGFSSERLSGRGFRMLFSMFLKKRRVGIVVTALSIVFMIVVMGVCQLFTRFSPDAEIARLYTEDSLSGTIIMQKGVYDNEFSQTLNINRFVRVTEDDKEGFRAAGYEGGIYPLYNVSLMTHVVNPAVWNIEAYSLPEDTANYKQFYCGSGLGVLVTEKSYLAKVYGNGDGEIDLLSGSLETEGDGVVLTDYLADSILAYNPNLRSPGEDVYASLIGRVIFYRFRVSGVVGTGYRDRYGALIEAAKAGQTEFEHDLLTAFIEEADSTLNIGYSFNPDFCAAYCADRDLNRTVYYGTVEAKCDRGAATSKRFCTSHSSLKPGQAYVRKDFCSSLLGIPESELTNDVVGTEFTATRYEFVPQGEEPDFTMELTVAGLLDVTSGNGDLALSPEDYAKFKEYGTIPYALYFDDLDSVTELYAAGEELNYIVRSPLVSAMYTVAKAALVFTDMFKLIVALMLILTVVTLVAFGVGSVRRGMYDIAVIRALGGKTRDLTLMFVLEMLIVSAVCCVISVIGLALGANVCNSILVEGFVLLVKNVFMRRLRIIAFDWGIMLIDAALVLFLTVVGAIVPFLIMRRAKPREIIRAKE